WSCSNVPFAAWRARSCPCPLCWIPACWYSAAAWPARRGGWSGPRWNVPGSRPRSTSCRRSGWPSWACGPVRTAQSWRRRSRSRPPENLAPVAADRLAKVWPMTTPPCAELHLHLEGTVEPELVFTLAERNQIPLDYPDPAALHAAKEFTDLQSFLDLYYACMQVLRTEEDFADLTRGYLARAREAGVRHAEIMVDPQGARRARSSVAGDGRRRSLRARCIAPGVRDQHRADRRVRAGPARRGGTGGPGGAAGDGRPAAGHRPGLGGGGLPAVVVHRGV